MKTRLRASTDPVFDADTIHVTLDDGQRLAVYCFVASDGVPVVQIDEQGAAGRLRVNLNDGPVWDGDTSATPDQGITITREQLAAWAGRALTDDEVERLDECIPNSSIPDAIDTIVSSFDPDEYKPLS